MILGRVVGSVVSTIKDEHFKGEKLMVVQPVDLDEQDTGISFMALDRMDAGQEDLVLVNMEGGGAKIIYERKMPVQAVIVAVVDRFEVSRG